MINGTKSVAYVAFQFFWWAYSSAIYNQPKKTIKGNLKHVWENWLTHEKLFAVLSATRVINHQNSTLNVNF